MKCVTLSLDEDEKPTHVPVDRVDPASSRAGVDGVREDLGGRAAVGRVELDAEVLVGPSGVVAAYDDHPLHAVRREERGGIQDGG